MRFTLPKSATHGQFWFRVVAANGQILATCEMYKQKASAVSAIESIKENASRAPVVDEP